MSKDKKEGPRSASGPRFSHCLIFSSVRRLRRSAGCGLAEGVWKLRAIQMKAIAAIARTLSGSGFVANVTTSHTTVVG
jgi:hypothetical protein